MISKKYLKKFAKEDRNSILAESGNLLQKLEAELADNPSRNQIKHFKPLFACISGLAVSIILLFSLLIFYPLGNTEKYQSENFQEYKSNIDEVNEDLQSLFFAIPADQPIYIQKTVDNKSGDIIYYTIDILRIGPLNKANFTVVCNKNYVFEDFTITKKFVRASFSGFPIYYQSNKSFDDEGNVVLSGSARIQTKHESIYITSFSKTLDDPLETFPHAIGEFIKPIS